MELGVPPHVVILPYPAMGHIKPMLSLAKLLSDHGFQVTFVNSEYNHDRLLRFTDVKILGNRIRFKSIPDGLPSDHPRTGRGAIDLFDSTKAVSKPEFRKLLISLRQETGEWRPPTCIIADGIMSFSIDIAEELGIPIIAFRTYSACCIWVYFHISMLIQHGEIPFQENEDMDGAVSCIPGLEDLLRRRDLPSICRSDVNDSVLQFFIGETASMRRASVLILDTFEELEGSIISKLSSFFPKVYTIGPLHALMKSRVTDSSSPSSLFNMWEEDRSSMAWLDSQLPNSVIYVSFGSIVSLSRQQLLEFWHGLVNSGRPFLWVIRPDLVAGDETAVQTPPELVEGTKKRGLMVDWVHQEEVLAHPAIGAFLTHSGWNSTLESIYAGVPMICWPVIADQQVNSRCVSELWRIGIDMKDVCDRKTVETMVRDLMMNDKREVIMRSMAEISMAARDCVKQGGSSDCNLEKLIEYIRSMN